MSKLTNEQIAEAKKLLAEMNKTNAGEKQIFIVEGSNHCYSNLENAIAQAAGKGGVYRLEIGKTDPVLVDSNKKEDASTASLTPDKSWKFEELKAYATEKGIVLDGTEKSKDQVLAKIEEAIKKPE